MNPSFTRHRYAFALCAVLAVRAMGTEHAQAQTLTVTATGRTVSAATAVERKKPVFIKVAKADAVRVCGKALQPGAVKIWYAVRSEVVVPSLLSETEREEADSKGEGAKERRSPSETPAENATGDAKSADQIFTIPGQPANAFIVLNVLRERIESSSVETCWTTLHEKKKHLTEKETAVKDAERALAAARTRASIAKGDLENLRASAALYGGSTTATSEIASLITNIDAARSKLIQAEQQVTDTETQLKKQQEALTTEQENVEDELGASISETERAIRMLAGGALLKIAGVSVGQFKAVYYDFAARAEQSTLQMMPLGAYPVVRYGDSLSAVIANVRPQTHPYAFFLAATAQDGVVINTDPVRPTFSVGALEARMDKPPLPTRLVTSEVYVDVVLPVRGSYAPNQYAEVTISTERPASDDPKKLSIVTLVDKARYPQFRALYRYNFNSGVFFSNIRNRSFQKVRTVLDDPATTDVDESRYEIVSTEGKRTVKPAFGLTYYLIPVDVQGPVGHERFVPNPTIGFAFANPADDIFVGFSHELLRNAQFFWGWHWGITTELHERNRVSEDRDPTAPLTREVRTTEFSVGLTFNLAVISKIFK